MRFEIAAAQNGASYLLKDTRTGTWVEVYTFGALLNQFVIKKGTEEINVVDGYTSIDDAKKRITDGFMSAKLSPFVCRLDKGQFEFEQQQFKIRKHYMGDSAIHGLVFDAVFAVTSTFADEHSAAVTLHYHYDTGEHGFPFAYSMDVHYQLSENGRLKVDTTVTNNGKNNMPLNDGWHPYFQLGDKLDNALLRFNSKEIVEFSDALLPTGNISSYTKFNEFRQMGSTELDNCFTLNDHDSPAFQIKANGIQLSIFPETSYPYLQIYTPPSRKSIAVENLSGIPDSFNNKTGLITLRPDEAQSFSTAYELKLV